MKCVKLTDGAVSHLVDVGNANKIAELTRAGFKEVRNSDGSTYVADMQYNRNIQNDDVRRILDNIKSDKEEKEPDFNVDIDADSIFDTQTY